MSALTKGRRSPMTSAWETYCELLSLFSMFCRRKVLPARGDDDVALAVCDRQEPVVVELADVAGAQPAVLAEHLARRFLVAEIAGEDRRPPEEDLAVVGDSDLDVRQRGPDRAEPEAVRQVAGRGRRPLRLAVALENQHVDGQEELGDLLGERRGA